MDVILFIFTFKLVIDGNILITDNEIKLNNCD